MIGWTGLAPWELEFPFPGGLTSTSRTAAKPLRGREWGALADWPPALTTLLLLLYYSQA